MTKDDKHCRWLTLAEALKGFAMPSGRTQSQAHIRPLHWYVACRLVLEGGFSPCDRARRLKKGDKYALCS